MGNIDSLFTAAAKFGTFAIEYEAIRHATLERGAKLFLKKAQAAMGTYEYGWPPLAESTIERKTTGDTPLIETRTMIESGGYTVHFGYAVVGFEDPKILVHEYGNAHVPPRPVVGGTVAKHGAEIAHKIGVRFGEVLESALIFSGGISAAISEFAGRE